MDKIAVTLSLDTSGKSCPMPMIETNLTMKKLQAGDVLEIIATDVGTQKDIPSWCGRKGHTLLDSSREQATFRYYVRKGNE